MNRTPEVIAAGILVPEGPVWCADGTVVVVSVGGGCLYRIWPDEHRKQVIADTAGGPNAAAPASDGWFIVTQNGGLDFKAIGAPGEWPPMRSTPRGLQYIRPDGAVGWLVSTMQAPNDLVVGPDNTVYFTDPFKFPAPPGSTRSRVVAMDPDGTFRVIADGLYFCNGIARETGGALVVTEDNGLMRIHLDGRKEWIVPNVSDKHATDGLCIDMEGRFYLASGHDQGIRVIEGNREVDFIPIPNGGMTTNCCFGGPDNRTLFATDGMAGTVLMWRDMPTPGLPVYAWTVPDVIKNAAYGTSTSFSRADR